MTRFCEVTEAEARDILTRAGLKPSRVLVDNPHGVYAYLAEPLDVTVETANKRLRKAGGQAVMWGNIPPTVWFYGLVEADNE